MATSPKLDRALAAIDQGDAQPVYLIHGDLVVAEPSALRLAEALAAKAGCELTVRRRPPSLVPVLDDLRTYSLFDAAKVSVVIDSALLSDRAAAADLIDQAQDVAVPSGGELPPKAREAASRLLQALRLFDLDPTRGESAGLIDQLPAWVLEGGKRRKRKRTKKQVGELRQGLVSLLDGAREAGLEGYGEGDLALLGQLLDDGLPDGYRLVLAESSVAADHPIVQRLATHGAVVDLGKVASERRGGWSGLEGLIEELEGETGAPIARDALGELARRTLRQGEGGAADPESTARLAGEYRKLASLSGGGRITRAMVEETVQDRGQEDVWQVLDAVSEGRPDEALKRLDRYLGAADDLLAARFSFFSLLASFCRHLVALRGMMRLQGVRPGDRNYNRFKSSTAPQLQAALPTGHKNPLSGIHPFRLHKAYLAASRFSDRQVAILPHRVLETELRLKGESDDPSGALASLLVFLTTAR